MKKKLLIQAALFFCCFFGGSALGFAQSQMITLPAQSTTYSSAVRGFWFVAPTNFTIVGLRVPLSAGTGAQNIQVMKIAPGPIVVWPTLGTNFTNLFYQNNIPSNTIVPVSIQVSTGDIIGVLGQAGTSTSYSANQTPFSASIGTYTVDLNRFLHQSNINVSPATDYSTEGPGLPIGRIEVYYQLGDLSCDGTPSAGTISAGQTQLDCNTTTPLELNGNTVGRNITHQWQYNTGSGWTGFGTDSSGATSPPINGPTQVRCIVTCDTVTGGVDTTPVRSLNVNAIQVDLGQDIFYCQGGLPITLRPTVSSSGSFTYLWSNNSTADSLKVFQPGRYYVKVITPTGCYGADTIKVTQDSIPINNLPQSIGLCEGEQTVLDAGNPGLNYLWNTSETTQSIMVDSGGIYSVTLTTANNCNTTYSIEVVERPLPLVDLGSDSSLCGNESLLLDAGNPGAVYRWNTNQTSQSIYASTSGTYYVKVTDSFGCVGRDTVIIRDLPSPYVQGFNFIPLFYEELGKVVFHMNVPEHVESCKWDFGDHSPTSTDWSPLHTYPDSGGVFGVTLTVYNHCDSFTTTLPIEVNTGTTGINFDEQATLDWALYPNPTSQSFTIELAKREPLYQVQLFDLSGRLVKEAVFAQGVSRAEMTTEGLTNGVYLVRIVTQHGNQIKKLTIKR